MVKRKVLFYDRLSKRLVSVAKEISQRFSILPDGWFPASLISGQLVNENDVIILAAHSWDDENIPVRLSKGIKALSKMNLRGKEIAFLGYDDKIFIETPPKAVMEALDHTGVVFMNLTENATIYPGVAIDIADKERVTAGDIEQYTDIMNKNRFLDPV